MAACLSLLWSTAAAAQDQPSVGDAADRPGFADSAVLAGRGHILLEAGVTLAHDGGDRASVRTVTGPQLELHGGLTPRVDVAVIWDGLVSARTRTVSSDVVDEDTTTGLDDFRVGVKIRLLRRPRCKAALIGYVTVPVGSEVVSRRYADPLARLAWSTTISNRLGVSGTVDLQAVREEDAELRAKPAASAALGSTLTGTLDAFVGIVAEPPAFASRPNVWSLEAGLVRAIGDRHQVDLWIGRRLSGDADGWFISAGVIRRLR